MMILAPEKTTIAGGRILIVDDDDGVRENLAELFQVVGYSVVTAGSAPEAMGKLAHHDVDLLLTDYRMPGPNGVELIESARRVKPGLRAILMTAFGDSFTDPRTAGGLNMMEPLQLSQTVMDEYSARILMGTFERPVSALELSRRFGIPIAACYRRIKELEGLGLVYCEQELPSRNGKGLQLFRSRLKSVRITLEDGNLRARVEVGPPGVLAAPQGEVREQTLNLRGAAPVIA